MWAGERDKTRERRAFKFCFDAERLRALKREVTLTRLLRETLGERDDIVRIHELRLDAPPYFLESELATDGNLLQWAEKMGGLGKIPLPERIELVAATATALAAAHSVGVLHKDIKPTNVLIFTGKDGHARPRLVDFGIGTLSDASVLAQHGITGAGFTGATLQHSSGTPTYSPPEYLAGKAFTVQGDVYSLGVMLYQLVTAQPDAPLAEGWQRDVPDELLREDIALCVDGDPTRRLPSAADLATRLRAHDERRKKLAAEREAAAAETARRRRQRQLRFTTAAAVIIAAITIPLTLWALREKGNAQDQSRLAVIAAEVAETERDKAKAQVREASRSDYATAQARLAEGKWQEGTAYLGRSVRYDPENRNAQDALWLALRHGQRDAGRLRLKGLKFKRDAFSASYSPDGMRILTANSDNTANVRDATTGESIGPSLQHIAVVSASYSPDGTRIVTASYDMTARVWDAITGQPIGALLIHDNLVNSASFSPDGTRIVTASWDETARVWDAITGQPICAPLKHINWVNTADYSPDGTRIVTASNDKTAQVWDASTGQPIGAPLKHSGWVLSASYSPDGTHIVTASSDGTARVWEARIDQPVTTDVAELLTAVCTGARLDPELGGLQFLAFADRDLLREKLAPFLATSAEWRFVVEHAQMHDPKTALVSPRMTMTLREATTRLIGTLNPANIQEAAGLDPGHPLLPFAHALREAGKTDTQPANPIRAAWLIAYGMKRLPADTTAPDLRLAARLIAAVAKNLPDQKPTALTLLDRAAQLSPEDDETKKLREELK